MLSSWTLELCSTEASVLAAQGPAHLPPLPQMQQMPAISVSVSSNGIQVDLGNTNSSAAGNNSTQPEAGMSIRVGSMGGAADVKSQARSLLDLLFPGVAGGSVQATCLGLEAPIEAHAGHGARYTAHVLPASSVVLEAMPNCRSRKFQCHGDSGTNALHRCCPAAAPTGVLGTVHAVKDAGRAAATTHFGDVLKLVADQSGGFCP